MGQINLYGLKEEIQGRLGLGEDYDLLGVEILFSPGGGMASINADISVNKKALVFGVMPPSGDSFPHPTDFPVETPPISRPDPSAPETYPLKPKRPGGKRKAKKKTGRAKRKDSLSDIKIRPGAEVSQVDFIKARTDLGRWKMNRLLTDIQEAALQETSGKHFKSLTEEQKKQVMRMHAEIKNS